MRKRQGFHHELLRIFSGLGGYVGTAVWTLTELKRFPEDEKR